MFNRFKRAIPLLLDNQTTKQTVAKNIFWLIFTELVTKAPTLITVALIARYLGVEQFGIFSLVFTFVTIFMVISDFGFNDFTIREMARKRGDIKKLLGPILLLKLFFSLLALSLVFISLLFIQKEITIKLLVFIAAFWMIFQGFYQFLFCIFRSHEVMQYEALLKMLYSYLLLIAIIAVVHFRLNIFFLVLSYVFTSFIIFVITILVIQRKFILLTLKTSSRGWGRLLVAMLPFAFTGIFYMIYSRIAIILLSFFRTNTEVGLYSAPYSFLFYLLFIPQALTGATYPLMSRLYKNNASILLTVIFFLFIISMVISIILGTILIYFSRQIVLFLYGPEFLQSVNVFRYLAIAVMLSFISHVLVMVAEATNKQFSVMLSTGICVILNIILNIIFIPKYGYLAAGMVTVITELVLLLLMVSLFIRNLVSGNQKIIKIAVANIKKHYLKYFNRF